MAKIKVEHKELTRIQLSPTKRVRIIQDIDSESPREWDNGTQMLCLIDRYNLGDRHDFKTPEAIQDHIDALGDKVLAFPIYAYIHSGIMLSLGEFGCRFDSGQVGMLVLHKEHFGDNLTQEEFKSIGENTLYTYNQWLAGDVWGYVVETWDPTPDMGWVEEDSCWGFYGSDFNTNGISEHVPELEGVKP